MGRVYHSLKYSIAMVLLGRSSKCRKTDLFSLSRHSALHVVQIFNSFNRPVAVAHIISDGVKISE